MVRLRTAEVKNQQDGVPSDVLNVVGFQFRSIVEDFQEIVCIRDDCKYQYHLKMGSDHSIHQRHSLTHVLGMAEWVEWVSLVSKKVDAVDFDPQSRAFIR